MSLTTAGITFLAGAATGQGTMFNNSNTYIGVGNSSTAFAVSQTDLIGGSKLRKKVDAGYPIVAGVAVKFKATFLPAEANFSWSEWGVFNAASSGVMLNRFVENNSTKVSNQTWILEVTLNFAVV